MHEVTCTHCGQVLQISPDACRCSRCGEDLRALIPPHRAANYFYRRSADLAARGDLPSALAEAERGLVFGESSELRLLAAILAKRMGDAATVRAHVSAIPVDDRLRQEAEWLIRSQPRRTQARNDARTDTLPQAHSAPTPPATSAGSTASVESPRAPNGSSSQQPAKGPALPAPPPPSASPPPAEDTPRLPRTALWAQRAWGAVALVMLIIAGAMGWTLVSGGPDALLALIPGLVEGTPNRIEAETSLQPVTPVPLILPTPTPNAGSTVPEDLVLVFTPEPLVEAAPETPPLQPSTLDLAAVLQAAGRTDLLALPLNATVEDNRVRVTGVVTSTAERLEIIDLLQKVSGAREVYAAELLVRVPTTYVVQEGDSLWSIANQFYGPDASHVSTLFESNRDVLPSAQSLQVGMVLNLPQIQ